MLSCGFEHCVCLIDGAVWSWGFGGSGCLGHGKYETLTTPKKVESLTDRVVFLEAGGYHNGVITDFGNVYTWGRSDVGQLAIEQKHLQRDQMGYVLLQPQQVQQLTGAAA
jgi:alpha-tubulin suppressor-like RCC1 family protein